MAISVGAHAPDFQLGGVDGRTGEAGRWRLSDEAGRPVVLAFYPYDNSSVCTRQLQNYTAGIDRLAELDAAVFAISPQDPLSHRRFAEAGGGFAFPLLSDLDKSVGRAYGILGLLDLYRRSIVVVDRDGIVRYTNRAVGPGLSFVPVDRLVETVAAL